MKKVFIICTVRGASDEYKKKLEDYVAKLEKEGCEVHLPHRDTNQEASGYEICMQNTRAITLAHEVHIFYNPDSQGTHFDMGVAFANGRKIVIVENIEYDPTKKSFARMLNEWSLIYKKDA
jgi:nucleoside 2-deoxyribosyltransferase